MALPDILVRIVKFLRAGYPDGVPRTDYIPLIALLKRRLTNDEIITIAGELTSHGHQPIDGTDIRVAVTKVTAELPDPEDIKRVAAHIATTGRSIADEFTPPN